MEELLKAINHLMRFYLYSVHSDTRPHLSDYNLKVYVHKSGKVEKFCDFFKYIFKVSYFTQGNLGFLLLPLQQ